ncbi:MAG: hypothetical protein WCK90_00580, partial [archaeon]
MKFEFAGNVTEAQIVEVLANAGTQENCGTGSGGFQPGNTCAKGVTIKLKPVKEDGIAKARKSWETLVGDTSKFFYLGNGFMVRTYKEGGVTLEFKPFQDEWRLAFIKTAPGFSGKGLASRALKELTEAADKAGVKMTLDVDPQRNEGETQKILTKAQLFKWYERNGFVRSRYEDGKLSDAMIRQPKREAANAGIPCGDSFIDPTKQCRVGTDLQGDASVMWHGSPSGDLQGKHYGIHIGTYKAAKEALEARIGIPATGTWDGTREYGKTLLAGKKTLKMLDPRGYNQTGYNSDAPEDDYYPDGSATYSDRSVVALTEKPSIFPVRIIGEMTNTPQSPTTDSGANSRMAALRKTGRAKRGYFYRNDGEDSGSVSAVVPSGEHLQRIDALQAANAGIPCGDGFISADKECRKVGIGYVPAKMKLAKPVVGPTGAKIVGYEWRSKIGTVWSELKQEDIEKRVSDWDTAGQSTGTGREIVHVFHVEHPDGTVKPEGIVSAQKVLGIHQSRLMTIAKKERAAQAYRAEMDESEKKSMDQRAASTPAEAAQQYRRDNHSTFRTIEQNNAVFNDSKLWHKGGKYLRRHSKADEQMEGFGWNRVETDPAKANEFDESKHPREKDGRFMQVTATPAFKAWFKQSKVLDDKGRPLVVYHGTQRPDRIGDKFLKSRATSGPMAFFTTDPEIASSYSTNKHDNSLEMPEDYADWFKIPNPYGKGESNVEQAWYFLTPEQRRLATESLYTIGRREEDESEPDAPIIAGGKSIMDRRGVEFELQQSRGNALKAAKEIWLNSGSLFGMEEKFLEVLHHMGVKGARLDDPNATYPAVIPVYLSIQHPLDTDNIPKDVMDSLEKVAMRQRKPKNDYGPDQWAKWTRDPKEWITILNSESKVSAGTVWTSIPDWVTKTLKAYGYDGINDTGGKGGGAKHDVWIPFESEQVKSAYGNNGKFSPKSKSISNEPCELQGVHFAWNEFDEGEHPRDRAGRFTDTRGVFKSPEFKAWFAGSKVKNRDGSPKIMFHGTWHPQNFGEFDTVGGSDLGAHFGSLSAASQFAAADMGSVPVTAFDDEDGEGSISNRIFPVVLSIKRPLRLPDLERWTDDQMRPALKKHGITYDKADYRYVSADMGHNYIDQFKRQNRMIMDAIEKAGYDGIVYRNKFEGGGDSYIAFHSSQVKSIFNRGTWSKESEDISNEFDEAKHPRESDGRFASGVNSPAFKDWFEGSKVTDAEGHPIVVYHGTPSPNFSKFNTSGTGSKASRTTADFNTSLGSHFSESSFTASLFASGLYKAGSGGVFPVYLSIKKPLMIGDGIVPPKLKAELEAELSKADKEFNDAERKDREERSRAVNPDALLKIIQTHGLDSEEFRSAMKRSDEYTAASARRDEAMHKLGKLKDDNRPLREEEIAALTGHTWSEIAAMPTSKRYKIGTALRDKLEEKGYDGVLYENGDEQEGQRVRTWIAFHPSQIKSVFNRGTWSKDDEDIGNEGILTGAKWVADEDGVPCGESYISSDKTCHVGESTYHVTYNGRLDSIAKNGLTPDRKRSIGGKSLDGYAHGKVFLSDKEGLGFWHMRAEQWAEDAADDPFKSKLVPVVLRIKKPAAMETDTEGSRDSTAAAYMVKGSIPPEHIEVFDGSGWLPISEHAKLNPKLGMDEELEYFHRKSPLIPREEHLGNEFDESKHPREADGRFASGPNSPAFKAWFAGSKIVDPDGNPLVVYHGTGADDFSVFQSHQPQTVYYADGTEVKEANSWDMGDDRKGMPEAYHYGAVSDASVMGPQAALKMRQADADKYDSKDVDTQRHLNDLKRLAAFTKIEHRTEVRPTNDGFYFTPDVNYSFIRDIGIRDQGRVLPVYLSIKNPIYLNSAQIENAAADWRIEKYKAMGYDGAIYASYKDDIRKTGWNGSTQIVAFYPEQIKSV